MILFTTKPRYETEIAFPIDVYPDIGRRGWRWVLRAEWRCIDLVMETIFLEQDAKWRAGSHYFAASITPHFQLGSEHGWYDGPHCSFSIGWLHFCWSYWNCKKCLKE